jgi:hypothetical protein
MRPGRPGVRLPQGAPGRGASVAGAALLGALCAWLLSPAGPPLARVRVWAVAWPLAGLGLTVAGEMHGPPLLLGFALDALMLWRDRRRESPGLASRSRSTGQPPEQQGGGRDPDHGGHEQGREVGGEVAG